MPKSSIKVGLILKAMSTTNQSMYLKPPQILRPQVFRPLQMIGKMLELHTAIPSLTSTRLLQSFKL